METTDHAGSPEPTGTAVQLTAVSPAPRDLPDDLILTRAAATLLRVDRRTVYRISTSASPMLTRYVTPGGHGRFSKREVIALRASMIPATPDQAVA